MGLYSIKLSLGSLLVLCIMACSNHRPLNIPEQKTDQTELCRLTPAAGVMVITKLGECRFCHLRLNGPRMRENIPLFKELMVLDSFKMSDYIFKSKHNGMFIKDYPEAGRTIDSLDDCERRNLIHYIKTNGARY